MKLSFLTALAVAITASTVAVAQPPPILHTQGFDGIEIGLGDLTADARARLRAAGVGDIRVTVLPAYQGVKPKADETASGYAAVWDRVEAGETVRVSVGDYPAAGYTAVSDWRAYRLTPGLWVCRKEGGRHLMRPEAEGGAARQPQQGETSQPSATAWQGRTPVTCGPNGCGPFGPPAPQAAPIWQPFGGAFRPFR